MPADSRRWSRGVPAGMAWLSVVGGIVSGLAIVIPWLDPLSGSHLSELLAVFVDIQPNLGWIVLQFLMAAALAARKRIAWALALLYLIALLIDDVSLLVWQLDDQGLFRQPFEPAIIGVALAVHLGLFIILVVSYREFWARVRRGAFLAAIGAYLLVMIGGTLLGFVLVELFPGTVRQGRRLAWTLNWVLGYGLGEVPGSPPGWLARFLGLFATLALVMALVVLFRSRRSIARLSQHDEAALRVLLGRFGTNDSLGYFATRRDKSVVFAPNGMAAVTYRVESGVCIAAADPIGDPAAWDAAIAAWSEAIRPYGWVRAVVGASQEGAAAYNRHGMKVLALGDEAVLNTDSFGLRGTEHTEVRQAVSRAKRAGVTVTIRRHHELSVTELDDVAALADRWRNGETERGFSMALDRIGDPADGQCLLVEASVGTDVVGLLSFVPWGRQGVSLDLMRRSPDAPNGTGELMVAGLCQQGRDLGIRRVSLNFAVFRSTFEKGAELGAGPLLRMWRAVLLFFSRWWQLESLYKSNAKYHPAWKARYLCFDEPHYLPQIGVAVGIAEGFLRRTPTLGNRRGVLAEVASGAPPLDALTAAPVAEPKRPEQVRVRIAKAERILAAGDEPWPVSQQPSSTIAELAAAPSGTHGSISGRIVAKRSFGGVVFVDVRDWSGDLQVVLEADQLGNEQDRFEADTDVGDVVGFVGTMGHSRSGEVSLLASAWRMDAKCLHPLPDKRRGIIDPEMRVRQRHLDLAVNPQARQLMRARSAVLRSLRDSLNEAGFCEVETPILQTVHGGANARPFTTHINAYDLDLYLRIAPELYLKRLCVGGMDKIFELGRTFRNEGVDYSHNPEFTILEAYEAHGDYRTMMKLCQRLIQQAAMAANGACVVPDPTTGELTDISGDWPVVSLHEVVSDALVAAGGHRVDTTSTVAELRDMCDLVEVNWRDDWNAGELTLELYEHLGEERTTRPTFYTDFPIEVSPLTRSHRSTPGVTERWDLVAWGVELGTAYSELTDPLEQRRRLTAQSELAAGGDPEAMELDEDFLAALEYGMPPTGGLGMGVDRVVMLITGASIRQTLPFPMIRPQ